MYYLKRAAVAAIVAAVPAAAGAQAAAPAVESVVIRGKRVAEGLQLDATSGSASRLGLSLRETPASVEVLTQDTLQQRGARTFSEALRGAAGLAGGGSPASPTTLSMRGFNNLLYLYDGTRNSGAGVVNRVQDTWNYERIEILKGPASVLNGDSAIGGIVNFVTKRPDRSKPGAEALLSWGSYGSVRAAAGLGGAVGDSGAFRIDFSHNDTRVGTIARNGERIDHLTSGLAFDFGTTTRLDLSFDYLRDDNQAYWGTPLVPASLAAEPTSVVSTPDGRVIDRRLTGNNYNVLDDENESDTTWVRATLTSRITPAWTLRNELAANRADRTFRNSESAVFFAPGSITRDQTLITHDQQYVFNRLDASHRGLLAGLDNRFNIGVEIGKTDFDSQRRFSDGSAATAARLRVPLLDPGATIFDDDQALNAGAGNRTDTTADVKTTSVFVENAVKLGGGFTVVGGLRRDRIEVQRSIDDLNLGTQSAFGTRYHASSGRLGAVLDLSAESSAYAQFTNATTPVSSLFLLSASGAPFPLSKGRQAEVGFKQSLAASRLEWTAALYRIELGNVLSRDPNNASVTLNNGQQSSKGVELAAAWRATPQLTLSANAAALRARFDTLVEAGGVSRVGNRPPNVPERVVNAFASYRLEAVPVELQLSVNHTGDTFTDTANLIRINGFTTADAAASWRLQPALLTLRVRNLGDKLYASYAGRATSQVLIAPQRTYELSATFDF